MATYQSEYKVKNGFGNIKMNRAFRMKMHDIKRREKRVESYAKNRELEVSNLNTTTDIKDDRYYKLLRWKAERDRRKNMEQVKKKPAFKVGIVHHNYYSPPVKDSATIPPEKQCLHGRKKMTQSATPPKRITRATQKRLIKKSVNPTEVPQHKKITGIKQELLTEKEKKNNSVKDERKPLVPSNYKFTAPSGLKNIPVFGSVTLLRTPVKTHRSVERRKSAKVFPIQRNSRLSNPKEDMKETNEEYATVDVETNTSIEAVKLNLSLNEHEQTFDGLFRNSTFSDNSHSEITSPGNISAIKAENTLLKDSPRNNKGNIFFSENIPETTENKISESTDNDQTKMKTPLRSSSILLTDINSPKDPVFFSPYIVSSRGKNNARKEQQMRRGIGSSPSEDIPTKETVMKNLNISIEDEERTAQYFSFLLSKETERLNELCKKWTEIQSKSDITEDTKYRINQAVGQTHLLINKKFERFRKLVLDCETGKGEMLVTCRDLQGFWDMMYMEIMNCDSRFEVLEKLRSNDWKEEEKPIVTKVTLKKKVGAKKKIVPKKQSSVQNFILAAKKKMKNNTENLEILENHVNENINQLSTAINNIDIEQEKTKVLRKSNTRQSLLQKTLLSESCKNTAKTPMTIMKISQMCKTPKIELDESISYINCKQTPSKGILKRTNDSVTNEMRCPKSVQKVNFDDHIILQEVPIDEETQNKLDLAARLERIETYDFDAEYINRDRRSVEPIKTLNFDDSLFIDSSSNLEGSSKQLHVIEKNDDILMNFEKEIAENISSKNEDVPLKISPKVSTRNEINTRILRNRVIVTNNSTRMSTGRKSTGLVDENKDHQTENKSPNKLKKDLQQMPNKIIQKNSLINITPVSLKKNLRRSSRNSVRFNAEECSGCSEYKPVHPMTPHTRRSKVDLDLTFLHGNNTIMQPPSPSTDLISWDSPKIPARVRRSSRCSNKRIL